jgi:hypothetical protein
MNLKRQEFCLIIKKKLQCATLTLAYNFCSVCTKLAWCSNIYRVLNLRHNPNYNSICKPWWHQYNKTNELFFSLHLLGKTYRTALQQVSTAFLKTQKNCVPKFCYQSVYCCLIRYLLFRIHIDKCFMNSSKRFWCKVMSENEHTFCSWIHNVCTCIAFAQLAWAAS